MTLLCAGRDPEWWTPGHEQARLAMLICSRCSGCPDNDPAPHGVIRRGVPYTDSGKPMHVCPNCGRPNTTYRGGVIGLCGLCAVPDIPIPGAPGDRRSQIAALVARELTNAQIAAHFGLRPETVRKLCRSYGIRRRASPLPVPDRVAA